ncbi:MAG: DUF4870 domain-containing protein [Candidatus Omnitrophica bacterium]|nr:DUF4870 domain-containing protein [Candidatus Omnitrophota bacterium]
MEEVKGAEISSTDIEKLFAFLSYILFFGILIYRTKKDSDYIQHHAKQGMILFVITLANFILMAIPVLGWVFIPLLNIALLVYFIIGAHNALSGKMNKLPLIGQFSNIIK